MDNEDDRKHPHPGLSRWEQKLAFVIARKFERNEPEDLEAELFRTVLELKARPPPNLQDWERYIAKALHNRAHNWVRDRRAKAKRDSALPEREAEILGFFTAAEADPESQVALTELRQELDPKLRDFLDQLIAAEGNHVKVARRLRMHRNTVRLWIRKIQRRLIAHGFQPGAQADEAIVQRIRPDPDKSIVLSSRLLRTLASNRLSGTQCRVLLCVTRETARRKQKMAPFRWSEIAKALSLDRGDAWRAGRCLSRAKLVFIQNGRIGLQRTFGQPRTRRN